MIRAQWCEGVRAIQSAASNGFRSNYGERPIPGQADGGWNRDRTRYHEKSMWEKAAALCRERGLDYRQLVRAALMDWTNVEPPYVTRLISQSTLERYSQAVDTGRRCRENELTTCDSAVAVASCELYCTGAAATREEAIRKVLRNESNHLSPVYRYCEARRRGMAELADRWRDKAVRIYVQDAPNFDATWGDRLPADLRAEADDAGVRR